MRESGSHLIPRIDSSMLSLQQKAMEWESGYRSGAPLSRLIMDVYGLRPTMDPELHFRLLFLAYLRISQVPKPMSIGPIRQRTRHDLGPLIKIDQMQYQSTMDALYRVAHCSVMESHQERS